MRAERGSIRPAPPDPWPGRRALCSVVAFALAACTGSIGGEGDAPGSFGGSAAPGQPSGTPTSMNGAGSGTPGAPPAVITPTGEKVTEFAKARVRRLTTSEINNSLRDIYLGGTPPSTPVAGDTPVRHAFDNQYDALGVPLELVSSLQETAEWTAAQAAKTLPALHPCNVGTTGEATCAKQFIDKFGRRTFRRPLSDDEKAELLQVFTDTRKATDYATSIATVVEALIQSPNFLFRTELGAPGSGPIARLDGYELASALSYLLWTSAPDDALLDAASAGTLSMPDGLATQVARMLQDTRAHDAARGFFFQWLEISDPAQLAQQKDPIRFPSFNAALAAGMVEETRRFLDNTLWSMDGRLSTLLTSTSTYVNADLAVLYGIKDGPASATFEPVALDGKTRAGLLTQASFLASLGAHDSFSPIQYGRFLKVKAFCQPLPPPPPQVPALPAPTNTTDSRARFAAHSQNAACSGCHKLFEPLGWAFETFDPIGRYRATENGRALTGDAEIVGTDVDGKLAGPMALVDKMLASDQVAACVASQWLQFALGRTMTDPAARLQIDDAAIPRVTAQFQAAKLDVKTLLTAVATSDVFLFRDVSQVPGGTR